jgi:dTDP-glucose pyrophosphorylase
MQNFKKYIISDTATIKDALIQLNVLSSEILTLFVVNGDGKLKGTLTDGDVRRALIAGKKLEDTVSVAYHSDFKYITLGETDVVRKIKNFKNTFRVHLLPLLDSDGKIVKIYNFRKQKNILPVDAVLMAGGKGVRLRPLTEKTPKPLLPLGDKAIIDYNIEALNAYGIDNIHVTVNYLREQIENHFKNTDIKCIREPQYLGTIGSIQYVEQFSHDAVLVMNSDLFTNVDYEDFYLHFQGSEADMSVVGIPYTVSVPYGIFDLQEDVIQGVKEKPLYNYYANGGIYLIKRELLNLIPHKTFFDATDFIDLMISKGFKVVCYTHTGYWIDIGKTEDYKRAQEFVKHIKS